MAVSASGEKLFRTVLLSSERLVPPLTELGQEAAAALKAAAQTVSVFESTTAGLVQASLQSQPGASAFTTCGAVSYSKQKAHAVLGAEALLPQPRPANGEAYKDSKRQALSVGDVCMSTRNVESLRDLDRNARETETPRGRFNLVPL
eukprot:symbB.v1.2.037859.t1/scaffold5712.1/size24325/2